MMFDLFKKEENKGTADVKSIRDALLRAIKSQLQKAEGGEGRNIKGIYLFITANTADKHIYEAAVYAEQEGQFKDEVQKIADDYALDLPENWMMEILFIDELPVGSIQLNGLEAHLFIRTKDNAIQKTESAYISILNGEAEKEVYVITSTDGKINIGREKRVQIEDGFFRLNQIAFPGDSPNEANKYISRQHAHIEWNNENGCFMLFADAGGVPPGNKIKIRSATSDNLNKLNSTQVGHKLSEGDQVILGETAVIEFSYKTEEQM